MMKSEAGVNFVLVSLVVALGLSLCVEAAISLPPEAKLLTRQYYKKTNTCANAEPFVKHQVKLWWNNDKNITAKLLKLLYADCMVTGCDASVLLDGAETEKKAPQNSWLDGFVLIDKIKKVLEIRCPRAVSCADILNLAVRDAVNLAGGPSYPVLLGRRDGLESNAASVDLPLPSITTEQGLAYFKSRGLDSVDYATLLGSHTMGRTHCEYIRDRLYNFMKTGKPDPSMTKSTLQKLRQQCPQTLKRGQTDPTVFLTEQHGDQYKFTNNYYSNVLAHRSVLTPDQDLLHSYNTSQLSLEYAGKRKDFYLQYALAISRMGTLKVLTGNQGEIRQNCRFTNKNNPYIN